MPLPILSLLKKSAHEPFRFFFPLGVLCALLGALYWPITIWQWGFVQLSSEFHVWMQIYGFLGAFVFGFLGTAVPRLTKTPTLTLFELMSLIALHFLLIGTLIKGQNFGAHLVFIVECLVFLSILAKRFRKRQQSPPATFVFLPFAFASALLGAGLQAALLLGFSWQPDIIYTLSRSLATQGFILFLLTGIGGFLIRSVLGWGQFLPTREGQALTIPKIAHKDLLLHGSAALALFLSFFLEAFVDFFWGAALKAGVVTLECLLQIRIHKIPVSGKITSHFLVASLWLLIAGLWGKAFFAPEYSIAFLHLSFIGGFSLSTFAVATRVILSHCGHSRLLEGSYRPFSIAASLLLLGLLSRFAANFVPAAYLSHLIYGSLLWSLGVLIWSYFILRKIFANQKQMA